MTDAVLIVDVDELERRRIALAFRESGFDVFEASSPVEALLEELDRRADLIVLAEEIPPLAVGELVALLRRLTNAPIMVVGGGGDPEETQALDMGSDFYLRRPYRPAVMLARASALLRRLRRIGSNVVCGRFSPLSARGRATLPDTRSG